jgi:hypothetical protein
VRIFPHAAVHTKKATLLGAFTPPYGFPRKKGVRLTNKSLIKRFYLKYAMLSKSPLHDIGALMTRDFRMNEIKERHNLSHLPIIKVPNEREISNTTFTFA